MNVTRQTSGNYATIHGLLITESGASPEGIYREHSTIFVLCIHLEEVENSSNTDSAVRFKRVHLQKWPGFSSSTISSLFSIFTVLTALITQMVTVTVAKVSLAVIFIVSGEASCVMVLLTVPMELMKEYVNLNCKIDCVLMCLTFPR